MFSLVSIICRLFVRESSVSSSSARKRASIRARAGGDRGEGAAGRQTEETGSNEGPHSSPGELCVRVARPHDHSA